MPGDRVCALPGHQKLADGDRLYSVSYQEAALGGSRRCAQVKIASWVAFPASFQVKRVRCSESCRTQKQTMPGCAVPTTGQLTGVMYDTLMVWYVNNRFLSLELE